MDTIYALSSGSLPSGVAVLRVSGPQVRVISTALCGILPDPRKAVLRPIRTRNGDVLDEGLVLFFPGPSSFTGEDCLELQIHGGRAVVTAVLSLLASFEGTRMAEAGEFSRRAFLNGKLDLVEIEGLADLIAADTELQRRLAVEQAGGALSALYDGWARRLTHARAMIEAELDFADEDDVPGSVSSRVWSDMRALLSEMDGHLKDGRVAEIIRDGFKIVIVGAPNAGKSSLLNALAQRDAAIVSNEPGTTRDLVTVEFSLAGFCVRITDTAGLRETDNLIEQEGIRRAERALQDADLVLSLSESDSFVSLPNISAPVLHIATKIDQRQNSWDRSRAELGLSIISMEGIDQLLVKLVDTMPKVETTSSLALPSRQRQKQNLQDCAHALKQAIAGSELDLQAEYLRQAGQSLGRLTGRVDVEDLLDVIFSTFCVGK